MCAAVVTASGCAAGFEPYTSPSYKPRDAANYPDTGNSSPVAVRHAYVLGPGPDEGPFAEGSDAAVYLSLVNQTTTPDRLVSAESPVAEEVEVKGGEQDGIQLPEPQQGRTEGEPVLVGQPPYSDNTVTLAKLTRELPNGSVARVTFTFQRAGEVTMELPVAPRVAHRSTLSPAPSETAASTPSGSPTAPGATSGSRTGTATPTE